VVEAVVVHPVDGLVAVRIYNPGAVTVTEAPLAVKPATFPVPAHVKVVPGVVEVPVRVALVKLQVRGPLLAALTPSGGAVQPPVSPGKAKTGFPIREESNVKDIMATLFLPRSKDNFICMGLV